MSRQREWQKRKQAAGLCVGCGNPRERSKRFCDDCLKKANERQKNLRSRVDKKRQALVQQEVENPGSP